MLADVTFSTEGIVVISTLLGAVTAALGFIFRLLITNYEKAATRAEVDHARERDSLKTERDNWRQVGEEAVDNLQIVARKKGALTRVAPLAAVVAEHNSPATEEQLQTAALATTRAALVAATLALELPPRPLALNAAEAKGNIAGKAAIVSVLAAEVSSELKAVSEGLNAVEPKEAQTPGDQP